MGRRLVRLMLRNCIEPIPIRCLVNALDALPYGTDFHYCYFDALRNETGMVIGNAGFKKVPDGCEIPSLTWAVDGNNYYLEEQPSYGH